MKHLPTHLLHVALELNNETRAVGRLALKDRHIWFEYHPDFITTGLQISPFKLPLKTGAIQCTDRVFEGLFGVFNDSLPDGWGRLLLDRQLNSYGIIPETLTALDRLAYVGERGMGALRYKPEVNIGNVHLDCLNLDHLAREAEIVLTGNSQKVFEDLLALNGSSNGALPKIVAAVSANKKQLYYGANKLAKGCSHWIIKFLAGMDSKDMGAIEYAYSHMARAAGIEIPETYLFPCKSHAGYFGVKRFDRVGNNSLHMHTLCGLIHADYRVPNLDYETFLKVTYLLTKDITEVEKAFRLAVFNVLAHNRDDHSKNFAFLMDHSGTWRLAPAYDLTFSYGPGGEQSMMVVGEGKNPKVTHLLALANKFSLKNAKAIIAQVSTSVAQWKKHASAAGVSRGSIEKIGKLLYPSRVRNSRVD